MYATSVCRCCSSAVVKSWVSSEENTVYGFLVVLLFSLPVTVQAQDTGMKGFVAEPSRVALTILRSDVYDI